MAVNRNHHSSKENKFQIVVIPEGDAGAKHSIRLTLAWFIAGASGFIVLLTASILLLFVYTPLSLLLPLSDAQLARRYGNELFDLQKRLNKLSEQVVVLREYNYKLRSVLGENVSKDSTFESGLSSRIAASAPTSEEKVVESSPGEELQQRPVTSSRSYSADFTASQFASTRTVQPSFPVSVPVAGYLSRKFEADRGHYGIDYAGKVGTLVTAAAEGYIVFSNWTFDDGNTMIVSHGRGYFTIYKHNQILLHSTGEMVKRGQPIALLGNSGKSYGPHLHFEIWKDGRPQNPEDYLIASE